MSLSSLLSNIILSSTLTKNPYKLLSTLNLTYFHLIPAGMYVCLKAYPQALIISASLLIKKPVNSFYHLIPVLTAISDGPIPNSSQTPTIAT